MNPVKPRAIAGVVGAIGTAAIGATYAAPVVATAATPHTTDIDIMAGEASTSTNALSLEAPEDLNSAPLSTNTLCSLSIV